MVIHIKKFTCAALTLALALPLSSCGEPPEPARPSLSLGGCECTAEYLGREYSLSLTNTPQSLFSVSFSSPDSLNGMVCAFMPNGCSVSFDDLSYKSDSSALSAASLPRILFDIMRSAADPQSLVLSSSNPDSQPPSALFKGNAGSFEYNISTDFSTGQIRSISSKEMGITIKFQ